MGVFFFAGRGRGVTSREQYYCKVGDGWKVCSMAVQEKFIEHGVVPDVIDVAPAEKAEVKMLAFRIGVQIEVRVHGKN